MDTMVWTPWYGAAHGSACAEIAAPVQCIALPPGKEGPGVKAYRELSPIQAKRNGIRCRPEAVQSRVAAGLPPPPLDTGAPRVASPWRRIALAA